MNSMKQWMRFIDNDLQQKYEFYNFNNAVEVLTQAYDDEWKEIVAALRLFTIKVSDLVIGGGNESAIPKHFSETLRPLDWKEIKITGDLVVRLHQRNPVVIEERKIVDFIDGHNIDYVKGEVAVDMEWNSKDQTFDRDLYAFRTFYDCGIIKCGVIITRSEALNAVFSDLGIKKKYGASTTWMGKLLPRIQSRRHGGCPILVVGILPKAVVDWSGNND